MDRDTYKFGLYYLGYNSSSTTPPSFANATFIRDVGFKLRTIPTSVAIGTTLIGTAETDGTITLNSSGQAIFDVFPFNPTRIIQLSSTLASGHFLIGLFVCKYFLPVCSLSFHYLNRVWAEQKFSF